MEKAESTPVRWPRTLPLDPDPLRGFRRTLTREDFEALAFYQCQPKEICGYAGVPLEKLKAWTRKVYRLDLEIILPMLQQDGIIEIRKTAYDHLKKSATLINQQYNRFIPVLPPENNEGQAAIEALIRLLDEEDEEDGDPDAVGEYGVAGA